jgi:hypothetical protein
VPGDREIQPCHRIKSVGFASVPFTSTAWARAVGEFLAELGRKYDIEDEVLDQLEEWNRLTPELLRAAGGDRWPLPVLAGGRR